MLRPDRTPQPRWLKVWGVVASIVVVLIGVPELIALRNERRGDTATEVVRHLDKVALATGALRALWLWVGWHFWLEPAAVDYDAGVWWDDIALVVSGFAWGMGAAKAAAQQRREQAATAHLRAATDAARAREA